MSPSSRPFVGRNAEIGRAIAALDRARKGKGGLLRVIGEPGIGKTRLADELSAAAVERDVRVAWGRCWEAGAAPPFWPWTQIVRSLGLESGLSALTGASPPTATVRSASPSEAEQARFQLFAAVASALGRAASATPCLIVLDDLHAADVPSLVLLRFVARGLRASRLLVLATHREIEARVREEVGEHLSKLSREGETIALQRLAEDDVTEWLRSVGRPTNAARRVHEATEGNPLFVQEVLEVFRDAGTSIGVPDAVHGAIAEHLARLSAGARALLGAMAVIGREAPRAEIAGLAEATLADVDAAVREASTLGVVDARGARAVAFRHILLRDELYDRLDASRRTELHARLASMLGERATRGDDDAMLRAAHHELEAALAGGRATHAIASARRAAARAMERVAYEQAADLLGRAVMLLEASSLRGDALEGELLVDWGEALILSGAGPRGREVCARGAAIAKAVGADGLVVRAALVYGSEVVPGRRDETMVSLLRDALTALGPHASATRARVMARLSTALMPTTGDPEEPGRLACEAIAMAREAGDEDALLHALYFASGPLVPRLDARERLALTTEAVQLAERLGRPAMAATVYPWVIAGELDVGSAHGSDRAIEGLARLVARTPQPTYRVRLPIARATRASLEARWSDAERHIAEADALAQQSEVPLPGLLVAFARLGLHYARGDGAAMAADYPAASTVFRTFPVGRLADALWVAMQARAERGDLDAARAFVRRQLTEVRPVIEAGAPLWGAAVAAATLVGARDLAADLEALIGRYPERNELFWLVGWAGTLGPRSLLLADFDALLGRTDSARRRYDAAIALATSIGAHAYAARATARRERLDAPARTSSGPPRPPPPAPTRPYDAAAPAPLPALALVADGETWRLCSGSSALHLRASKGLSYLATLLAHPNEEIHVTWLVGAGDEAWGDAGPMLDEAAKAAYRRRATDLRETIEEADARGDAATSEAAREELDTLANELARAVGLGGRDRKAASAVERMRINVQRRLRDAIARISAQDAALGKHLETSVRTGAFCSYVPALIRR
jgi:hypothetical protein